MARGQQKIQAQQKRAEKEAKRKKQKDNKGKNGSSGPSEKQTICMICKQLITQLSKDKKKSQPKLRQHIDSRHSKLTLKDCFPTYTDEAIACAKISLSISFVRFAYSFHLNPRGSKPCGSCFPRLKCNDPYRS